MNPSRMETDLLGPVRRRMIEETELAMLYGLCFPERHPRIPTMEAGTRRFNPAYAAEFWSSALGVELRPDTPAGFHSRL